MYTSANLTSLIRTTITVTHAELACVEVGGESFVSILAIV